MERTIEDAKKQILNADITESKFTQDEDKMIYYFLLSALRREHYEAVGLTDRKQSFHCLDDSEKLTIIENLNARKKAIIRRDFLIENFKGAYRDNAIAGFLLAFSKKHMPEELANIEASGRFCLAPSPKPPAVETCPDLVGHRLSLMAENPECPENVGYAKTAHAPDEPLGAGCQCAFR